MPEEGMHTFIVKFAPFEGSAPKTFRIKAERIKELGGGDSHIEFYVGEKKVGQLRGVILGWWIDDSDTYDF